MPNNKQLPDSLNKYFAESRPAEMMRSQLHFAEYNPRTITTEGRKLLKRSIKRFGVVGGIVVNEQTGMTVVGGHQKLCVLDGLNHYDPETGEGDYRLRVELVNVDAKTEKELNITLNNPNVGGQWDLEALASLVPDIDYKEAGLTEADLNLIGCDYLLKTPGENDIANAISDLATPLAEKRSAERQAVREAAEASVDDVADSDAPADDAAAQAAAEADFAARTERMKEVKRQVREKAEAEAENMDAYVMLSFDTYKAKALFMERFGYDPQAKFLKGEAFDAQVERVE